MSMKKGFSLAEMMIVLLIVAVVLAATAPMITRRVARERSDKIFDMLNTDPTNAVEYVKGRDQRIYMNARTDGYVGIVETGVTIPSNSVVLGLGNLVGTPPSNLVSIGFNNSTWNDSVAIGYNAKTGKNSVAIGSGAAYIISSSGLGASAAPQDTVQIGYNATTGKEATAVGYNAEASGEGGTAAGHGAIAKGNTATAIGYSANVDSAGGTAVGYATNANATRATAIGDQAQATGYDSTALGYSARTTGYASTAIGYKANATGSKSVAIGYEAQTEHNNTIVLGNQYATVYIPGNLIVGKTTLVGADDVKYNADDGQNKRYPLFIKMHKSHDHDGAQFTDLIQLVESHWADDYKGGEDVAMSMTVTGKRGATVGPYDFVVPDNNTEAKYSDNQKICSPYKSYKNGDKHQWRRIDNGSCPETKDMEKLRDSETSVYHSDIRLKNVGEEFTGGLADLSKLKFYHYTFKNDKKKIPQVGVIAQDLQKVFPDAVKKGKDGYLSIRWDEMFFAAINAIKELNTKVIAISEKLQTVTEDIANLKALAQKQQETIDANTEAIAELTARVEKLENRKKK